MLRDAETVDGLSGLAVVLGAYWGVVPLAVAPLGWELLLCLPQRLDAPGWWIASLAVIAAAAAALLLLDRARRRIRRERGGSGAAGPPP